MKRWLRRVAAWWWSNDLTRLATVWGTDKWGAHWYTQHYARYFAPLRLGRLNLLEIGVGGYDDPAQGARSLRMWKSFFPRARIVGIDLFDKSHLSEQRIDVLQCDQTDAAALRRISERYGGFDIIIDDGSHINGHVTTTFEILFPLLRPDGIYAVEDTQTAYWPSFGGGVDAPGSMLAYFKSLTDGLNHVEFPIEDYTPTYFDRNIVEIAFFHNLVIIRKGSYTETSNAPAMVDLEMAALRTGGDSPA